MCEDGEGCRRLPLLRALGQARGRARVRARARARVRVRVRVRTRALPPGGAQGGPAAALGLA